MRNSSFASRVTKALIPKSTWKSSELLVNNVRPSVGPSAESKGYRSPKGGPMGPVGEQAASGKLRPRSRRPSR